MSIRVELKPEVEAMLQKRALARGCDVAGYVEHLIEKDVLASQPFDEILAPIRQGFQQSEMSDDELETLFEEAREDAFQARQAKLK
jgi:site-specific recombinase XerC